MFAPRLSLPWNKRYRYTFGDLVVTMSSSRSISLAGRILLKQYIKDCVGSKSEYCHWSNEHLFILDNYKYFDTPNGRIYSPCPRIDVYEMPNFRIPCKEYWHQIFTTNHFNTPRLLKMVSVICAACGEDTHKTMADDNNLHDIFYGENFYCRTCKCKYRKTIEAAIGSFPADNFEDKAMRDEYAELVLLTKALSPKTVFPSSFK